MIEDNDEKECLENIFEEIDRKMLTMLLK